MDFFHAHPQDLVEQILDVRGRCRFGRSASPLANFPLAGSCSVRRLAGRRRRGGGEKTLRIGTEHLLTDGPAVQGHLDHATLNLEQPGFTHHGSQAHGSAHVLPLVHGGAEQAVELSDGMVLGDGSVVGLDHVVYFGELEPASRLENPVMRVST